MKKNRTIPFGYRMSNGEIVIDEIEANAVEKIFTDYISGNSLKEIADRMKVPYSEVSTAWNKNMVKRILENEKYLGTEIYQEIITDEIFKKANEKKQRKSTSNCGISQKLQVIRSLSHCKECGKKLSRIGGNSRSEKWDCKNTDCSKFEFRLTDQMLISEILNILNTVIANPDLLDVSEEISEYAPSLEVTRQQNEINRLMDSVNVDFEKTKEEIFRLAALKYDCCTYDDRPQKTAYLRDLLAEKEQLNMLDIGLLKSTVSRILISHSCIIEVEFINEKIIENKLGKDEKNDSDNAQCNSNSAEKTVA